MIAQSLEKINPTPAATNGSGPDHDAKIKSLLEAARVPDEPEEAVEQQSLLDQLAALDLDTEELRAWALDRAGQLSQMPGADFGKFELAIKQKVGSEWMRLVLRKAVNDERKKSNSVTWTHYIEAARELGFTFRLNLVDDSLECSGERMSDVAEAELLSRLHEQGLTNVDVARRAFMTEAGFNRYHPVKDYLENLAWNGQDHIAKLCSYFTDSHEPIAYADNERRTVLHAFLYRWLVGAVGKVYDPTQNQNPMLIMDGDQGRGKSYFVKWLCSPLPHLHFEGAIRPDDKDYLVYLIGRWIWEVGELGATIRRSDREALKGFITLQDATVRPAWGRYALHKPAMASFIGTVNVEHGLLNDPTGHRRFRPVNVTSIDWAYAENVDPNQVWAQAYALYQKGETWRLTDEERQAHAEITALYEVEDIFEGHIRKWFDVDPATKDADMFEHTTDIIHVLRTYASVKGTDRGLSMEVATTLKKMGFTHENKQRRNQQQGYMGIKRRLDNAD